MSHAPPKATPQTWPEWGVDTAVTRGDSSGKNTLRSALAQLLKTAIVRASIGGPLPLSFGDWLIRRFDLGDA